MRILILLLSLGCCVLPGRVEARTAALARTEVPPRIDGTLDDPAWEAATVLDGFLQVDPVEGAEPSERTKILLLYDDEVLYIGVLCYDREPEKIIAKQMTHDVDMTSDDRINFVFDTFHDERNAFFFQINPVGARSDALIENNTKFRREWDTIWYGEARVNHEGWAAEIAVPFRSISFASDETTWGLEVERLIRRRNEKVRWANPSPNRSIATVGGIGTLTDIRGIEGTGLDVKPTFSWTYASDEVTGDRDRLGRPGLDVFYKVSSATTAAVTFNTDFSDAPVDDRQTNLTRFALFFPETRDFFLQDAGIFEFGGLEENGMPFFSRRVGIVGDRVVDLDAGLKLTGRTERLNFGALQVRTASEGQLDATNLAVGRVRVNLFGETTAGAIFTYGDPADEIDNALGGVDFNYRDSRFRGDKILEGDVWFQRSFSSGQDGREAAFGARLDYPNDHVDTSIAFTEIQENFTPALGFVSRAGIRRYDGEYRYRWRPPGYFRTVDVGLAGLLVTDRDDDLESGQVTLTLVQATSHAGDQITLRYIFSEERLTEPFVIAPATAIAVDDYGFDRYSFGFATTNSRPVAASLEFIWGEFYDGRLQETTAILALRPSPQLFLQIEYEQNDARLPRRTVLTPREQALLGAPISEGDFTQRLVRMNLNVNFAPDLSWTNVAQYDNGTDSLSINSRLRWEIDSGNEFFLVWNQGYDAHHSSIAPTSTQLTGKLGWTFRF